MKLAIETGYIGTRYYCDTSTFGLGMYWDTVSLGHDTIGTRYLLGHSWDTV